MWYPKCYVYQVYHHCPHEKERYFHSNMLEVEPIFGETTHRPFTSLVQFSVATLAPPVVPFSCTWRQPLDRWDRSHTHPKMPLPPVRFAATSRCSGEAGVPSVSETNSELCLEIIPPRLRVARLHGHQAQKGCYSQAMKDLGWQGRSLVNKSI